MVLTKLCSQLILLGVFIKSFFFFKIKHCKNCEKLPWEYLIGYQGVKLFLLKDVNITIVTTATVTTVTITTVTIWVYEFC